MDSSLLLLLGFGAILIVILNDWTKRKAIQRRNEEGAPDNPKLQDAKTSWGIVAWLVMTFVVYAIALNHRDDLLKRDFGPFTRMVRFFLEPPKH